LATCLIALSICVLSGGVDIWAQSGGEREWTDTTGRFKVVGSLVEVKDGVAFIKNAEGKTLKVPVAKLSRKDQEFLDGGPSPFEVVESGDDAPTASSEATTPASSGTATETSSEFDWSSPVTVDWDAADEFQSMIGVEWNVPLPESGGLDFEPKRAALAKKSTFHEGMHPLAVNPLCKRAAVGYTVSFAVPKPLSRLSLVDLVAGKAVNSEQVEANMRPLTVLNDGKSVLMVGASDERGGYETSDQLQVWKVSGKKIVRSASWIPYPLDKEDWGKQKNAAVILAVPIREHLVLTCSDKGHVVLWELAARKPVWHARLSDNFALAPSIDRSLLAVFDGKAVMVVKTETAEIVGSTSLEQNTHVAWPRIAWSPSGKRLLVSFTSDVRVLDVEKGEWLFSYNSPSGPVAPNALSYPHDDYALLDNHLLVHLPTKIQVCDYRDAGRIETRGGTAFIALLTDAGGLLAPGTFPHPAAEKLLEKAQSDPSLFLIHPGVSVAIDVSGISGPYQQGVRQGLEKSARASGYTVEQTAPIVIVGAISGPKQEAISYIASGSYVVNAFTSTIKLVWNGRELWQTSGTNVPGMLMTKRGETIEQALAEAGKQPNFAIFESTRFPEFMQKPGENQQRGQSSAALMTSQFTMQGLVDSK
ncbi:MAG: SHD1 domain-containing protein, partial [Pirellulaceae bacterium]